MNKTTIDPRNQVFFVHATAIVEEGVTIGHGTKIWDHVHIRNNVQIGSNCIIGEKTYIAYEVIIGNLVKINSFVYICTGVTIEDMVMISAGTVFTNDKFPRAMLPDLGGLFTSEPTDETLKAFVRRGATIGANVTIGPGIQIGEYSMIGMGAVVTRDVKPFELVYGNPARLRGYVCMCGNLLTKGGPFDVVRCQKCNRAYRLCSGTLKPITK